MCVNAKCAAPTAAPLHQCCAPPRADYSLIAGLGKSNHLSPGENHHYAGFCGVSSKQMCSVPITSLQGEPNQYFGYLPGEGAVKYVKFEDNMEEYVGPRYCA